MIPQEDILPRKLCLTKLGTDIIGHSYMRISEIMSEYAIAAKDKEEIRNIMNCTQFPYTAHFTRSELTS